MDMHMIPRRYTGVDETLGIGSMAGDTIGAVGKGVGKVGLGVGKLGVGLTIGTVGLVGRAAIATATSAPVKTGAKIMGKMIAGTPGFLMHGYGPLGSPVKGAAKLIGKVGKNMVDYKEGHLQYNRYLGKLERKGPSLHITKFGAGILGGLAAIQGIRGGTNAYMASRMGTVDTKTSSLTPDYSPQEYKVQHPDFAGATGDLVFALNANRHG